MFSVGEQSTENACGRDQNGMTSEAKRNFQIPTFLLNAIRMIKLWRTGRREHLACMGKL
jgi:hypothetical protein